jgi:hypothetical protein
MRRTILLFTILALSTAAAWRRGEAYMLHVGKTDVTMTSTNIEELVSLRHRLGDGAYLWVRIGGREWLIRDEAFLREATAMWAPIQALEPEQHALGEEERRLDHRIDAVEDGKAKGEPGELARLRERDRVVSARQHEIEQRSEAMEKVVEAKLRVMVDQAIRDGLAKPMR